MMSRLSFCLLAAFGLATSAHADPITGCVTELPPTVQYRLPAHYEVAVWSDPTPGCHPSTENARPTGGAYTIEYFGDGSELLTLFDCHFEVGKSHQIDIRARGTDGEFYHYLDFVYDKREQKGNCGPNQAMESGATSFGAMGAGADNGAGNPPGVSVTPPSEGDPPTVCVGCGPGQTSFTPVPEPTTLTLLGGGLLYVWRRMRRSEVRREERPVNEDLWRIHDTL
jgi:hypothetical protein